MKKVLEILKEVREEVLADKEGCSSKAKCYSVFRRKLEEGIFRYYSNEKYYLNEVRRDDRYAYKTYDVKRKGESGYFRIALSISTKKERRDYFIIDIEFKNVNDLDTLLDKHIDEESNSNNNSIISAYDKIDEELLAGFKEVTANIIKAIENKEEISFDNSYSLDNIMKRYNERIRKYNEVKR